MADAGGCGGCPHGGGDDGGRMDEDDAEQKYWRAPKQPDMFEHKQVGSYDQMVLNLQKAVTDAKAARSQRQPGQKFNILSCGHGGRDTTCTLALVDALARDPELSKDVAVTVLSCSWTSDVWVKHMQTYIRFLEERKQIPADLVAWTEWSFHLYQHGELMKEFREYMEDKDLILQCEQGLDLFVPLTNPLLQDNHEDWGIHWAVMKYAKKKNIKALLVQTNAGLDAGKGPEAAEISDSFYGADGALGPDFSKCKVTWPENVKLGSEDEEAGKRAQMPDVMMLAVTGGRCRNKRELLKASMGFDPKEWMGTTSASKNFSIYAGFFVYMAAHSDAMISIAGMLDIVSSRNDFKAISHPEAIPHATIPDELPAPQWLFGVLSTKEEPLRVFTEYDEALGEVGNNEASTTADWLAALMKFRRRKRGWVVKPGEIDGRFYQHFGIQAGLAKCFTEAVREIHKDFDLWKDEGFLRRALNWVVREIDSDREGKHWHKWKDMNEAKTDGQRDDRKMVMKEVDANIIYMLTRAPLANSLDFICRLLEAEDYDAELKQIYEHDVPIRILGEKHFQPLLPVWDGIKDPKMEWSPEKGKFPVSETPHGIIFDHLFIAFSDEARRQKTG